MLDSEDVWVDDFEDLPKAENPFEGVTNLVNLINGKVTGKLTVGTPSTVQFSPSPQFTWNSAVFLATLLSLPPTPDPVSPMLAIAQGWASSVLTSIVVITPGATFNPPTGNGIVGAALAIIDAPVVAAAQVVLATELIAGGNATGKDVVMPKALRKAFASISYTITGTDTTGPTPVPIVQPLTPVE